MGSTPSQQKPRLNPHNLIVLPLEATLLVTPKASLVWLGPKNSLIESAEASAQASALASAALAASGGPVSKRQSVAQRVIQQNPGQYEASLLVKESVMIALSADLFATDAPVTVIKYSALNPAAFLLKVKSNRRRVQDDSDSPEEIARQTTIKVTEYKLRKRFRRLKKLRHENVLSFLFAVASTSSDPKINPPPEKVKKGRKYASLFYNVFEYCDRGTLEDAFSCLRFPLAFPIKLSLCLDIFNGLQYIHRKFGPLGKLSPRTCYITDGWRLKIYVGGFDAVAEKGSSSTSISLDPYEKHAMQLFCSPDDIEAFPHNFKSKEGDVYSGAILMNMILNDGSRPFSDHPNLPDLIKLLSTDQHSFLRPTLPKECPSTLLTLIQDSWSFFPENRPRIQKIIATLSNFLQDHIPTSKNLNLELHLTKIFSQDLAMYLLELEAAQSHLSTNLGEAVTKRFADSESRINSIRQEYQRQIDFLEEQLGQTQQDVHAKATNLHQETSSMQSKLISLEQASLQARLSLLPDPISKAITETVHTIQKSSKSEVPDLDTLFRPTIFPAATVLVVSIAGFNRYVQQLHNAPKILIEMLRAYYQGIDSIVSSCNKEFGGPRVHVVERITDACVIVSGAPDRDDKSVRHVIEVGVKLIEWAARFDASKILGGASGGAARLMLRVGVHTGPVLAGLVGKVPKLVVMGETLNTATVVETTCAVQELCVSAFTHSQLLSMGLEDGFVFEGKDDIEIRGKGRLGVFKVLVDRG
ncbi:hypothetical protein HDU79_007720 [Rhizoclosmatium sp. JEL0117]|nr:hypothetical protein HDU79_007720 [Rhizoclosmatium sp. JEL0117]